MCKGTLLRVSRGVCVCGCVCVRERGGEREKARHGWGGSELAEWWILIIGLQVQQLCGLSIA